MYFIRRAAEVSSREVNVRNTASEGDGGLGMARGRIGSRSAPL
jgi:hypothetical protein